MAKRLDALIILTRFCVSLIVFGCAPAFTLAQTTYNPRQVTQNVALFDAATTTFAAPGASDAVSFVATAVGVQITGSASAFSAVLQRSSTDPSVAANWVTVQTYSGAAGSVAYATFSEPGVGWWRISVSSVTGGVVMATLTGRRG